MQALSPKYARLSDFRSPTPKILYGQLLKDIRFLQHSITRFGLLNPLVVSKNRHRLMVIDGRKRLAALRRLRFDGKLPRGLVRVPYVMVDHSRSSQTDMSLLSNIEKYEAVKTLREQGASLSDTARHLHISKDKVRDLLKVDHLSKRLKAAFLGNALTLSQVKAFATIPNTAAQDDLLMQLGPFAKETDILKAITDGETVLSLEDDTVIILPSRRHADTYVPHAA